MQVLTKDIFVYRKVLSRECIGYFRMSIMTDRVLANNMKISCTLVKYS